MYMYMFLYMDESQTAKARYDTAPDLIPSSGYRTNIRDRQDYGMSNSSPVSDPYNYLGIVPHPDGTITRDDNRFPCVAATPDLSHQVPVLSKDIPVNDEKSTWLRLYLPRERLDRSSISGDGDGHSAGKLPLVIYFHGGGFVLGRVDMQMFHEFCANMARELNAIVASASYRLAPEHRLPAAYDDGMEALHWIRTSSSSDEEWLKNHADLSNCFVMGTSAGGNLAYVVGKRAASLATADLAPLQIRGIILHHPFFGGVERSRSEIRLANDAVLPPIVSDVFWDLSLPVGVDRDHEYCNPTVGGGLEKIGRLGWKVMVIGCEGDPLIERQREVLELMKKYEVEAVGDFIDGYCHGVEIADPSMAKSMFHKIKDFMSFSTA